MEAPSTLVSTRGPMSDGSESSPVGGCPRPEEDVSLHNSIRVPEDEIGTDVTRDKASGAKHDNLVRMTDEVCSLLQRYKASSIQLATRVERGEMLEDIFPVIEGPARPRKVTEVLTKFAAARHQVRLAMFVLGSEQRINNSAMGRHLGLSRQLASRLATEASATLP